MNIVPITQNNFSSALSLLKKNQLPTEDISETTKLFVLEDEKSNGSLGGAIGLASQFGFDLGGNGGGVFSGDNLLELMKSRSIIEKVLLTTVHIKGKKKT